MIRATATIAALALLSPVAGVHAQTNPDSLAARNDCKHVEQIFKTGHPAADLTWAAGQASACGVQGMHQGAEFIQRYGATPAGEAAALYLAAQANSAELFDAGLALATSGSSSRVKVVGLVIALRQLYPGQGSTVDGLSSRQDGRRCSSGHLSGIGPESVTSLPADAATRLEAVARLASTVGGSSDIARNASACVLRELEVKQDTADPDVEFDPRR
jgi:hypothetical protein